MILNPSNCKPVCAGAMPGGASPFMPFPRPVSPYGMPVDPNKPFLVVKHLLVRVAKHPQELLVVVSAPMPPMPMPINPMYPACTAFIPSTFPPALSPFK